MKKNILCISAVLAAASMFFISCGSTQLYSWYGYQEDYYHYVKNNDKDSLEKLLETYGKMTDSQNGIRGAVPPGIYADYGYLLIEAGRTEEGKAMLAKEIELYPESEVFVGSILKRVQ